MKVVFLCFLCLFSYNVAGNPSAEWDATADRLYETFESMGLPAWNLSYVKNMSQIQSSDILENQTVLLDKMQSTISAFNRPALNPDQQLDFDLIKYHIELNRYRLVLEKRWWQGESVEISDQGIQTLPFGAQWYAYYLKQWVDLEVEPDQLYTFGLAEVERVYAHLQRIQSASGMGTDEFDRHVKSELFLINDPKQVQQEFELASRRINEKLPEYYPFLDMVPALKIARGTNKNLAQTPAYYRESTLFFNVFDKPYNRRQLEWIYLHEAMPGHHYQISISEKLTRSKFQKLSRHYGYSEGWGAYVEDIAQIYGFYSDVYDELGKWEWDIIRSVRIVLDIGLNYYGWSDAKALAYWQQYIPGKDDIAEREIARMKRWPAQVITYKYGAHQFMQWKTKREQLPGFSLLEFHRDILQQGSMPLSVLERRVVSQ